MKRIASLVFVALLVPVSCKQKEKAAAPATSAVVPAPLASTAVLPTSDSGASFEGEIALRAQGKLSGTDGAPLNLTLLIKDGKVRVDVPENVTASHGLGKTYLLALPADKKLYAVLDAKKQAILLELDKLAEQAKAFGGSARPNAAGPAQARLEKTGKIDSVAGTKCEVWHYTQGKTAGEACIAEQETPWFQLPIAAASPEYSGLSAIADGKHLPLRFVSTEQGTERGRLEVTGIEKKPLQSSQFELPADYTVLSLDQMLQSMLGGLGMPSGMKLPPGITLPPGMKLPPNMKLPSK